jgi:hypothetical protein
MLARRGQIRKAGILGPQLVLLAVLITALRFLLRRLKVITLFFRAAAVPVQAQTGKLQLLLAHNP